MRIIAKSTLIKFWEESPQYSDAKEPTLAWHKLVTQMDWASPSDLKSTYRNASILRNGRVVFNIAGNKYRIITWINYPYHIVYVRFIGTHSQYDQIDAHNI